MSDELTTLRAKVKAQGDYIRKLRGEHRAMSEQFEGRLAGYRDRVRKLSAELSAAEADERSCAFCPEIVNPDSYISHLQSALKWHDEHVPRPTNPRSTCVVLEGEKPPEEVLFVREGGGVTHYLPEATCHTVAMDCFGNPPYNQSGLNGNSTACGCSECGAPWSTTGLFRGNRLKHNFKACPICGARIVEVSE